MLPLEYLAIRQHRMLEHDFAIASHPQQGYDLRPIFTELEGGIVVVRMIFRFGFGCIWVDVLFSWVNATMVRLLNFGHR